jgi:hypothetical protein
VDLSQVKDSITCECGQKLEVSAEILAAAAATGTEAAAPGRGHILASLRNHWRLLTIAAGAVAAAVVVLSFLYGPDLVLGRWAADDGDASSDAAKIENPEIYLQTLADNAREDEHSEAAVMLTRLKDPVIVPRLCQLAGRAELVSRALVVKVLGDKGEESALTTLGPMVGDADRAIMLAAVEAVTRINTPMAESILIDSVRLPSRARDVLPAIAAVRNDVATRVLTFALDDPSLRALAMEQIAAGRQAGCVPALVNLARNRLVLDADRMASIDALGRINTPESRRALISLAQDDDLGWKARQVRERLNDQ